MSESVCPFCGTGLDADLRARSAPIPPATRLSRAALFALGTGAASLASAACSSSSTTGSEHGDAAGSESTGQSAMSAIPLYGGTGMMFSTPTSTSSSNFAVPYGVPASMYTSSGNSSSGGMVSAQPAYGASATGHGPPGSSASSDHESSAKTPDGGSPDGSLAGAYGGPPQGDSVDFCDAGCGGGADDALA